MPGRFLPRRASALALVIASALLWWSCAGGAVPPSPTLEPSGSGTVAELCGASQNPWGYNFCGRGAVISSPPGNFCSYFNCIANFANGRGHVTECRDGTFSKSGGISGSCSGHGGNGRTLYAP